MRNPGDKLRKLIEEKENFERYVQKLNYQVQTKQITPKERTFLIELRTNGIPPNEYLEKLNAQILHTSRYSNIYNHKHVKILTVTSLIILVFATILLIRPQLTGLIIYDSQQYAINVEENYTQGKTLYYFNIESLNNTGNITSISISGKYSENLL